MQEKTWSLAGDVRIAFQSVLFVLKKNPSISLAIISGMFPIQPFKLNLLFS